jgi:hypothetical protein
MNNFSKTLLAVALAASAGAANASIGVGSTDATRELYMQAYDSVQKKTYSLDLGITLATLHGNRLDAGYEISVDLSVDPNWIAFTNPASFNPASTQYVLATGRAGRVYVTQKVGNPLPQYNATSNISNTANVINNHAQEINYGLVQDQSINVSKLVADTDADTAKWANGLGATPNSIWGSTGGSEAAVNFGEKADFWAAFSGVPTTTFLLPGQWLLSATKLEYKVFQPTVIPLPAAVWMFGAGLMGLLGATRRKYSVE